MPEAFPNCPTCDQKIPRGHELCPHCGLSIRESLRRSEKPAEERPPAELFEVPVNLSPELKFSIGLFFFLAMIAIATAAFFSGLVFAVTGISLTPAFQHWQQQRQWGLHRRVLLASCGGILGLCLWSMHL